jgi:hypothetical protein
MFVEMFEMEIVKKGTSCRRLVCRGHKMMIA